MLLTPLERAFSPTPSASVSPLCTNDAHLSPGPAFPLTLPLHQTSPWASPRLLTPTGSHTGLCLPKAVPSSCPHVRAALPSPPQIPTVPCPEQLPKTGSLTTGPRSFLLSTLPFRGSSWSRRHCSVHVPFSVTHLSQIEKHLAPSPQTLIII